MSLFDVILVQLSALSYQTIVSKMVVFLLVILVTWILGRNIKYIIGKLLRKAMPYYYINIQIYIKWLIWTVGLFFALSTLGLSKEVLEIVLIMIGIGVIVGVKDPIQNILARPFLDVYSDYKVGDWIRIGETSGKVIEVNALNTILMTKKGDMAVVPNSLFIKSVMINESYQAGYEVTIPVIVDKDVDDIELEKNILELGVGVKKYLKEGVSPSVITIKTDEKSKELALTLILKDRENKALVVSKVKDEIKRLLDKINEDTKSS